MQDAKLPKQDDQYFLRWLRGLYIWHTNIHFSHALKQVSFHVHRASNKSRLKQIEGKITCNTLPSQIQYVNICNLFKAKLIWFFVVARQWNPEAAEKMLRQVWKQNKKKIKIDESFTLPFLQSLQWRQQWEVDTALKTWKPPEPLVSYVPWGLTGYDVDKAPGTIFYES